MGFDNLQADKMHYTQLPADEAGHEKAHLGSIGQKADLPIKQESEVLELTRTGWHDTLVTHTAEGKVEAAYLLKVPFKLWGWTAQLQDLSGAHPSIQLVKPGAVFPSGCPLSVQASSGEVLTAFRGNRYWMSHAAMKKEFQVHGHTFLWKAKFYRQAVLVEKDSGTELAVHRGRWKCFKTTTLTIYSGKSAAFGLERDMVVATCLAFAELTREKRRRCVTSLGMGA